jgi:hypothetical protein
MVFRGHEKVNLRVNKPCFLHSWCSLYYAYSMINQQLMKFSTSSFVSGLWKLFDSRRIAYPSPEACYLRRHRRCRQLQQRQADLPESAARPSQDALPAQSFNVGPLLPACDEWSHSLAAAELQRRRTQPLISMIKHHCRGVGVLWTVLHRTLLESWYLAVQPEAGSVC